MNTRETMANMKVVVLTSSFAAKARADQADNLIQVRMVVDILVDLGFEVSIISATLDMESLSRQLGMLQPDLVFNLVEEIQGKGAFIYYPLAVLEDLDIAYTGNGHTAMVMASSKLLAKKMMLAHNILTPQWLTLSDSFQNKAIKGCWIIKSVWEHGSLGLGRTSVIKEFSADKIEQRINRLRKKYGGTWFVEKFIPGRELNVSMLGTRYGAKVLPVAEIIFENYSEEVPKIVDYQAKWEDESISARATRRRFITDTADKTLIDQIEDIALKCWDVFELSGYARVDFRIDHESIPFVLEVNTNPCLSPDAGFMAAAGRAGMSPVQVVNAIVQTGLGRQ